MYYWKYQSFDDQPIEHLLAENRIVMSSCLMHADNEKVQIKMLLQDMRKKDYKVTQVYTLSDIVK